METGFKKVNNRMIGMSKDFEEKLENQRIEIEKIKATTESLESEPKRRRRDDFPPTPVTGSKLTEPKGAKGPASRKPEKQVNTDSYQAAKKPMIHSTGDIPITPVTKPSAKILA